MWTIIIHGEADDLMYRLLVDIERSDYAIGVEHADFSGAVFVLNAIAEGETPKAMRVRRMDASGAGTGEPFLLTWEGLDSVEVH